MSGNSTAAVRSHVQERQWLLHLGNGNIADAVMRLARQAETDEQTRHPGLDNSNLVQRYASQTDSVL